MAYRLGVVVAAGFGRETGRYGMELTGPADDNDETEDAADLFRVVGRQVRLLRERAG